MPCSVYLLGYLPTISGHLADSNMSKAYYVLRPQAGRPFAMPFAPFGVSVLREGLIIFLHFHLLKAAAVAKARVTEGGVALIIMTVVS